MSTQQVSIDGQFPLRSRRSNTVRLLNSSLSTIKRLEQSGHLTVIKDSATGAVFHPMPEVIALAQGLGPGQIRRSKLPKKTR